METLGLPLKEQEDGYLHTEALEGGIHPTNTVLKANRHPGDHLVHILDLFAEDSRVNDYAGERELRPPGAPTTGPDRGEWGRWANPWRSLRTNPHRRMATSTPLRSLR